MMQRPRIVKAIKCLEPQQLRAKKPRKKRAACGVEAATLLACLEVKGANNLCKEQYQALTKCQTQVKKSLGGHRPTDNHHIQELAKHHMKNKE